MVKPYGHTDLLIYFNFYHRSGREDFLEKHFYYVNLGDEDDLLEHITEWIEEINRMDEYMQFKSIQFFYEQRGHVFSGFSWGNAYYTQMD